MATLHKGVLLAGGDSPQRGTTPPVIPAAFLKGSRTHGALTTPPPSQASQAFATPPKAITNLAASTR